MEIKFLTSEGKKIFIRSNLDIAQIENWDTHKEFKDLLFDIFFEDVQCPLSFKRLVDAQTFAFGAQWMANHIELNREKI